MLDSRTILDNPDVTVVDNSILTAIATCPTLAALRYALDLTMDEDRAPLQAGHMAHEVLAAYLRGADVNEALAVPAFAEYIAWATDAVELNDRLAPGNVKAILQRWLETHPLATLPFQVDPTLVEVGFAVPLDHDIVFVGRMDALAQDASGAWYVVEHKTTGRLDERWRKRYRTSAQITGYVWAAQQHLQQPVVGCFVNGIEFARLPTDTKKCRTHGVPYPECGPQHARFDLLIEHRAPHQIDAWVEAARRLARRYAHLKATVPSLEALKDVPMHGQFTGACPDCQFMDFCRVGRPAASAAAMMRVEPWSPFLHAFGESHETSAS